MAYKGISRSSLTPLGQTREFLQNGNYKWYSDYGWEEAVKSGNVDAYAYAVMNGNNVDIKDAYLLSERSVLDALYNEIGGDRENKDKVHEYTDYEDGREIVKTFVGSDYDFNNFNFNREREYNFNKLLDQQKEHWTGFEKTMNESGVILGSAAKGFINFFQDLGALAMSSEYVSLFKEIDKAKKNGQGILDGWLNNLHRWQTRLGKDNLEEAMSEIKKEAGPFVSNDGSLMEGNAAHITSVLESGAQSLGQMAAAAVLTAGIGAVAGTAGGTTSAGAFAGKTKAITSTTMFYSSNTAGELTENYERYKNSGLSTQAIVSNVVLRNVAQAAIEVGLGRLLGDSIADSFIFGRSGEGALKATRVMRKLPAGVRVPGQLLYSAFEEGLEEVLQDTSDFLINKAYAEFAPNGGIINDYNDISFQSLSDAFIIGALNSLIIGGVGIAMTDPIIVNTFDKDGEFSFNNDGDVITKKLGKFTSWQLGIDLQTMNNALERLGSLTRDPEFKIKLDATESKLKEYKDRLQKLKGKKKKSTRSDIAKIKEGINTLTSEKEGLESSIQESEKTREGNNEYATLVMTIGNMLTYVKEVCNAMGTERVKVANEYLTRITENIKAGKYNEGADVADLHKLTEEISSKISMLPSSALSDLAAKVRYAKVREKETNKDVIDAIRETIAKDNKNVNKEDVVVTKEGDSTVTENVGESAIVITPEMESVENRNKDISSYEIKSRVESMLSESDKTTIMQIMNKSGVKNIDEALTFLLYTDSPLYSFSGMLSYDSVRPILFDIYNKLYDLTPDSELVNVFFKQIVSYALNPHNEFDISKLDIKGTSRLPLSLVHGVINKLWKNLTSKNMSVADISDSVDYFLYKLELINKNTTIIFNDFTKSYIEQIKRELSSDSATVRYSGFNSLMRGTFLKDGITYLVEHTEGEKAFNMLLIKNGLTLQDIYKMTTDEFDNFIKDLTYDFEITRDNSNNIYIANSCSPEYKLDIIFPFKYPMRDGNSYEYGMGSRPAQQKQLSKVMVNGVSLLADPYDPNADFITLSNIESYPKLLNPEIYKQIFDLAKNDLEMDYPGLSDKEVSSRMDVIKYLNDYLSLNTNLEIIQGPLGYQLAELVTYEELNISFSFMGIKYKNLSDILNSKLDNFEMHTKYGTFTLQFSDIGEANGSAHSAGIYVNERLRGNEKYVKSTILHELTHVFQNHNAWIQGSSPAFFQSIIDNSYSKDADKEAIRLRKDLIKHINVYGLTGSDLKDKMVYMLYLSVHGEAAAFGKTNLVKSPLSGQIIKTENRVLYISPWGGTYIFDRIKSTNVSNAQMKLDIHEQLLQMVSPESYLNGFDNNIDFNQYYENLGRYMYSSVKDAADGEVGYIEIDGKRYSLGQYDEIIGLLKSGKEAKVISSTFNSKYVKVAGYMYYSDGNIHSEKITDNGTQLLLPCDTLSYSFPIEDRVNLPFEEYKKRWEEFSKTRDYNVSLDTKQSGKYIDRVPMLDSNGELMLDKSGKPKFKYLYDSSRRNTKITKADIENDPSLKNFKTQTMTAKRKSLINNLGKLKKLPAKLRNGIDNGTLTIFDAKEYLSNTENINRNIFDAINASVYKNEYITSPEHLDSLVDTFDRLAASVKLIDNALDAENKARLGVSIQQDAIDTIAEFGSKVDQMTVDDILKWADNFVKKNDRNDRKLAEQIGNVNRKVVSGKNGKHYYVDLDIKESLLRNLFMEYFDGTAESIRKISNIARTSAYISQFEAHKVISYEGSIGDDKNSRTVEETFGDEELDGVGEYDTYDGASASDTFSDLFAKGLLDEESIEAYSFLFKKYLLEKMQDGSAMEQARVYARDLLDGLPVKKDALIAAYHAAESDPNFSMENAINNAKKIEEARKLAKQKDAGETSVQLSRKMKNLTTKIRKNFSVKEYQDLVKSNPEIFNSDGSINRNTYISNNKIDTTKIKSVISQFENILNSHKKTIAVDKIAALKKINRETKETIRKQKITIKEQKEKIKELKSHVNFKVGTNIVTIGSDIDMPEKMRTLFETVFDDKEMRQSATQEVGGQEFVRHNAETFFEKNSDLLTHLSTQDALNIVDFFTKGGITITGDLASSQQVYAVSLWTLAYFVKGNKLGQFSFSMDEQLRIREQVNSFVSTSAMTMSLWRDILKKINPTQITMETASLSAEIAFRPDDLSRLADAVNANDLNRMVIIKQEMYDNTVKDYATLNELLKERARLRKKGEDLTDIEDRIIHNAVYERLKAYDEIEGTKLAETVLKSNGINKATVLDRILKWEQISMLSSPGTWMRNFFTNVAIGGIGKTVGGLNSLSGLIGDKSTSILMRLFPKLKENDSITGQYQIIGTKTSDRAKNFIDSVNAEKLYDVVADGLIKYSEPGAVSHKNAQKSIEDMIMESVLSKLRLQNRYDPVTNKLSEYLFKMLSDDKFVKRATISYFGKILTEKEADIHDWKNLNRITLGYFADAYSMAAYDYMHKRNFINRIENDIKSRLGDKAFFIYKQIFPFAAASTNWFLEGLNYTPMGLAKAIINFAKLENTIEKVQNARKKGDASYDSAFTKYVVTRNIGKGIIGSIGWIAGALLAAFGRVRINEDKDKYMLKIGDVDVDISSLYGTQGIFIGLTTVGLIRDMANNTGNVKGVADIFTQTFNAMFEDSVFSSMWNTFRWTDGIGESITLAPYTMLNMMIPNFIKTLVGTTMIYKISYSGGFLNKVERLGASVAPWGFDKQIDPYTGENMMLYGGSDDVGGIFRTVLANLMNKYTEIKIYPYEVSTAEHESTALGVHKTQLTGNWNVGGKEIKLSTGEKEELNRFYGKLNSESLNQLIASKTRYRVEDENSKIVELPYSKMTDKEKAAVINRLMANNSGYAKIYLLTKDGEYSYYATESEYKELQRIGVKKNIYKATDKKKGFYKS